MEAENHAKLSGLENKLEIECESKQQAALRVYSALLPIVIDAASVLPDDPFLTGILKRYDPLLTAMLEIPQFRNNRNNPIDPASFDKIHDFRKAFVLGSTKNATALNLT